MPVLFFEDFEKEQSFFLSSSKERSDVFAIKKKLWVMINKYS